MGLFDTVWITCPLCSARVEMQIKPPQIEGEMQEWELAEAPLPVMARVASWNEECDCGYTLEVQRDPYKCGQWRLMAAKYFPIKRLATEDDANPSLRT